MEMISDLESSGAEIDFGIEEIEGDGNDTEGSEDNDDDDEDDDDDDAPASFGSAIGNQNSNKSDPKGGKPGQSPFSASSLSFATSTLVSGVSHSQYSLLFRLDG